MHLQVSIIKCYRFFVNDLFFLSEAFGDKVAAGFMNWVDSSHLIIIGYGLVLYILCMFIYEPFYDEFANRLDKKPIILKIVLGLSGIALFYFALHSAAMKVCESS